LRQTLAMICLVPLLGCMTAPATAGSGDTITIENSGSTNMKGYRIAVTPDGMARTDDGRAASLPPDLFAKLKSDVTMAMPLHDLKTGACMKSVSFGSSTFISLGDERSGDLSCPAGPKGEALSGDADSVAQFVGAGGARRPAGP